MAQIEWAKLFKDAAEGPKFDVLPNGDYPLEVKKVDVKPTAKGETMFAMQCAVLNGPHAKRIIFHNLTVPGASAENGQARAAYFINDLKTIGLTQQFIDAQPQADQIAQALLGKTFIAQLDQREYPPNSGTMRNNVKRMKKAPAGLAAPGAAAPIPAPAPPAPAQGYAPPAPQAAPAPPQPVAQPQAAQPPQPVQQQYAQPAPQAAPVPQPVPVQQAAPAPSPVPAPDQQYAQPEYAQPAAQPVAQQGAPELPASPFGPQ
jgi:hypothetical protein